MFDDLVVKKEEPRPTESCTTNVPKFVCPNCKTVSTSYLLYVDANNKPRKLCYKCHSDWIRKNVPEVEECL